LQAFVNAKKVARANPADAVLKRHVEEAKEAST
jgi:hypothetical protein